MWEHDYLGDSRLVDACVQRLRAKVEDVPSSPTLIRTVRGVGYRLDTLRRIVGREQHSERCREEHQERRGGAAPGRRWTSLRVRLIAVFGLVALAAAVSASGIAYWLNREAVLTRTQDTALRDFKQEMQNRAAVLPLRPTEEELRRAAGQMAASGGGYSVLLLGEREEGKPIVGASDPDRFTWKDVPKPLRAAVAEEQEVGSGNEHPYHLFWLRTERGGTPYLVGGTRIIGGGPTGYMYKSLEPERQDLNSLAWSLGVATLVALLGSALLAQFAATTVLRPVHRLGEAARRLGEGRLDTRLRVSGTDELAELARTFNDAAENLQKKVADMSAREESSRRFVADMSHELRTPMTALTAVTEVLEEEQDGLDPMIAPAVALVVSETRRLEHAGREPDGGDPASTRARPGWCSTIVDVADQVTACIDARAWLDAVELDAERGLVARLDPRRLDVILANLIGNALKHGGRRCGSRCGRTATTSSYGYGTTVRAFLRRCCRTCSTASTRRARRGRARRAAGSACRSPWRTPSSTAGASRRRTRPTATEPSSLLRLPRDGSWPAGTAARAHGRAAEGTATVQGMRNSGVTGKQAPEPSGAASATGPGSRAAGGTGRGAAGRRRRGAGARGRRGAGWPGRAVPWRAPRGGRPVSSPRASRSTVRTAVLPISARGRRTVVSGGADQRTPGRSSKPTTLMSSGTRSPRRRSASMAPSAIWSLAANRAVGGSSSSTRAAPPANPEAWEKSPGTTSASSTARPAPSRAAR